MPPSAKLTASRFVPSLRDGAALPLPLAPAIFAGLAAMERAKAWGATSGYEYVVYIAVTASAYLALRFAWKVARQWITARQRSRPTV